MDDKIMVDRVYFDTLNSNSIECNYLAARRFFNFDHWQERIGENVGYWLYDHVCSPLGNALYALACKVDVDLADYLAETNCHACIRCRREVLPPQPVQEPICHACAMQAPLLS